MSIGNAYVTRMPAGFLGQVTRQDNSLLEPGIIDTSYPPTKYGTFVKMTSGKVRTIASGDAATDVRGIIVRPFPVQEYSSNEALDAATPDIYRPCDILKRGYVMVKFAGTTAAKGGQVNVCISASGGGTVGDITETTDSYNVAVTNCFFTGAADTSYDSMVEVSYNIER